MSGKSISFNSITLLILVMTTLLPQPAVAQPSLPIDPQYLGTLASALTSYRESADLDLLTAKLWELRGAESGITESGIAHDVPFFSQFTDISAPSWRKVGCGIASVAMLIDYYRPNSADVDALLVQGIDSGAYLDNAGWTHAGLINLTRPFGLSGASNSLASLSADAALSRLQTVVAEGPVMASVHYTFDPQNPIPHLVVITGVDDEYVYYNDPAEPQGGGVISIEQFQKGWKQRYITIRPETTLSHVDHSNDVSGFL